MRPVRRQINERSSAAAGGEGRDVRKEVFVEGAEHHVRREQGAGSSLV